MCVQQLAVLKKLATEKQARGWAPKLMFWRVHFCSPAPRTTLEHVSVVQEAVEHGADGGPRLSPKSMASRYGSQALGPGTMAESVITSFPLAGFEVGFAFPFVERFSGLGWQLGSRGSGITEMAVFAASESVITSMAGFGSHRPQPLGG